MIGWVLGLARRFFTLKPHNEVERIVFDCIYALTSYARTVMM